MTTDLYHIIRNHKINGVHNKLSGDYSRLRGNCTNIWGKCFNIRGFVTNLIGDISNINGDVSQIRGNISVNVCGDFSGIYGNITGIEGNVSNLIGDLDRCKLTSYERRTGIEIKYLRNRYSFLGTKTYREHYDRNGNGKRAFDTRLDVLEFLNMLKKHGKDAPVNIYKCPYCNKWHYGQGY